LKGVLFHLIADHHRRRQRAPAALPQEHDPADSTDDLKEAEARFLESWRAELLDRSWKALAAHETETGKPYFRVLRMRSQHPDLRSEAMAEQLTAELGRPIAATWVRQSLHRAREQFAEFLFEEIRQTLADPSLDEIEQELAVTGLHTYCKPMLEKLRSS
jgi:RNA polymerase sigma-70 factor (ECF subfamily)